MTHAANAHVAVQDLVAIDSHLSPALVEEIDPERVLLGQEAVETLKSALAELPERTRDIFLLHRLEKMRQRDIAVHLGISVSSVEKHIVKAIAFLTREMAGK